VINDPAQTAFDNVRDLGAIIKESWPGQQHVGFLFKDGDQPAEIVHLKFHYKLTRELPSNDYYWIQSALDEVSRRVIKAAVIEVSSNDQLPIPYSPIYEGVYFNKSTLRYVRNATGDGLTCATFILAVLEAIGFQLLDVRTWKSRVEDKNNIDLLLKILSDHAGQEHVEAIRARPHGIRFRPEEVAGAFSEATLPVGFDHAEALGKQVLQAIKQAEGSPTPGVAAAPPEG
jgi:hypothetical protein